MRTNCLSRAISIRFEGRWRFALPIRPIQEAPSSSLLSAMVGYDRSVMEKLGADSVAALRQDAEEGGALGLGYIQCKYPLHRYHPRMAEVECVCKSVWGGRNAASIFGQTPEIVLGVLGVKGVIDNAVRLLLRRSYLSLDCIPPLSPTALRGWYSGNCSGPWGRWAMSTTPLIVAQIVPMGLATLPGLRAPRLTCVTCVGRRRYVQCMCPTQKPLG